MRKVVWIFGLSWAIFCLITTGATVLHPGVFNDSLRNPNVEQDQADGIYNQGARLAQGQQIVSGQKAVFIDAYNSLQNLSVVYWLYPVELIGSRYGTDLSLALEHPEQPTIVYIGPLDTYRRSLDSVQPGFQAMVVTTVEDSVFAVIKKS